MNGHRTSDVIDVISLGAYICVRVLEARDRVESAYARAAQAHRLATVLHEQAVSVHHRAMKLRHELSARIAQPVWA
jgi:hypothetical protein